MSPWQLSEFEALGDHKPTKTRSRSMMNVADAKFSLRLRLDLIKHRRSSRVFSGLWSPDALPRISKMYSSGVFAKFIRQIIGQIMKGRKICIFVPIEILQGLAA